MRILTDILDLFMPRVCHICGCRLSDDEQFLCGCCLGSLPRSYFHHRPMHPMEQRFAGRVPYRRATGFFLYTKDCHIASLIHDFKYRKFPGLAVRLGEVMGEELFLSGFFSDVDLILPVPLHIHKQAFRGYNQVEKIAKGISRKAGVAVGDNLYARKGHKTQTSMTHDQRLENTRGIFGVRNAEALKGKHVVILDDVCTTGATLLSASETLLALPDPPEISLLTLAVVE